MNRMIALGAATVVIAGAAAAPSIAERNRTGDLAWLEQQLSHAPMTWSERDVDGSQRRVRLGAAELQRLELSRAVHAYRAGNDVPLRRLASRQLAHAVSD
jgi:hypothetical protein